MTEIIIPNPERRRALIIVDIQQGFLNSGDKWIVPNVIELIKDGGYNLFVECIFHADKGSFWDRETHWTFKEAPTTKKIKDIIDPDKIVTIRKTSKSAFHGNQDLVEILKENGIEEVHVVGFDTNDCVLSTANDAFDLGFYSYVIEEATDSSESADLREAALKILRENDMTNHSKLISSKKVIL